MEQIRATDQGMQVNVPTGQIGARDVLTEILRQGAEEMLAAAIQNEVQEYLAACADQRDQAGHRTDCYRRAGR